MRQVQIVVIIISSVLGASLSYARSYNIKQSYLPHCIDQIAQWGSIPKDPQQRVLCMLSNHSHLLRSDFWQKRWLQMRRNISFDACAVLYVDESYAHYWPEVRARLGNRPVFTLSTLNGFIDKGGMIQCQDEDQAFDQVKLNLHEMRLAGLWVNELLIAHADEVIDRF